MADHEVKFIILDVEDEVLAEAEAATGDAAVVLRLHFEGQSEPDPREYPFANRAALERTFEIAGLAPCLLNPAKFESYWTVTDRQLQQLADGSVGRLINSGV